MQKLIITLLFLLPLMTLYSQTTIHVPGDYPTIQAAIDAATNGDIVLVAEDTYYENINYKGKAITVASHFLNDGDTSHITNTIIDGSQPSNPDSGSVVSFISGEDTTSVLCGFTITGGTGTFYFPSDYRLGGGIILFLSGAKICNNIITSNTIDNTTIYSRCFGGGILAYSESHNLIISNNVISNNLIENSSVVGGGISIYQSGPTWVISNKIIDNVINSNGGSGGGIDIWNPYSEVYVRNNIIRGNQALTNNYGGGGIDIYASSSPIFISNNLIAENTGYLGGGILVDDTPEGDFRKMINFNLINNILDENDRFDNSSFPTNKALFEAIIENNTVVNNNATSYCGGIYCRNTSPEVRNSIVWGNQAPAGSQIEGAGFVEYSDVEGSYPGTGNMNEDPNFNDSTYFCLNQNSNCVDAGNPDPMYNDVEDPQNPGNPLWPAQGTLRNDMGHCGGPNSTWQIVVPDTIYVPGDYLTIQEAIDAAYDGNVVLVADGTYLENINYKGKAITVASHFLVDSLESHIENTIIDGSEPVNPDSGSVVYFISGEDTNSVLCGFTITGGTGTYHAPYDDITGGGIYLFPSGGKICNNIIEYNSVSYNNYSHGGGIVADVEGFSLIIENNIIRNNTTNANVGTSGGGISVWTTNYARIVNNKIFDNTATCSIRGWGGGLNCNGVSNEFHINNNYLRGNECITNSHGGGGISVYNGTPVIKNNLIIGNSTFSGGGVLIETGTHSSSPSDGFIQGRSTQNKNGLNPTQTISKINQSETLLENNTIANNIATQYGGGIFAGAVMPQLINCIIWGNTAPADSQISGTVNVVYSDVEGGWTGEGNIDSDPLFSDTLFHLSDSSPCMEAGIDSIDIGGTMYYCPPFCYYGVARPSPQGTMPDIGACENPNPVVGVQYELSLIPDEYSLAQNYPNPFNPTTTIVYGLIERTNVELKLFDVLGREVETIVNREQDAGYYEVEFNASRLASGIYFYRLQAGNFVQIKKMMLLK